MEKWNDGKKERWNNGIMESGMIECLIAWMKGVTKEVKSNQ